MLQCYYLQVHLKRDLRCCCKKSIQEQMKKTGNIAQFARGELKGCCPRQISDRKRTMLLVYAFYFRGLMIF